ncbi:multiprotein-bridging factor 1 family protein [Cryptosporangium sp. NPDC051539]|uniref:multiprotein-bridging factor 1 family protein n=1 Tax=Cryptosporangium sp. NPDC051539 TaxID=3363962 RepID=UPI0037B02603
MDLQPATDREVIAVRQRGQTPNDRLRQARLRRSSPTGSGRPMSRQELADRANEFIFGEIGREVGLDANYIGKLERGEHRWPNDLYRRAFRAVLTAEADADLGFFIVRGSSAPEHQEPAAGDQLGAVATAVGACLDHGYRSDEPARTEQHDDAMKRRELLGLLSATAPAVFASRVEAIRAIVATAAGDDVTDLDRDGWERVAFDYAHEVGFQPGQRVLPNLLSDIEELAPLIETATGSAAVQLRHITARLSALAAIAFTGAGDVPSARRWWRTTARLADRTGDAPLSSLVRGRQAVYGLYEGRPPSSVLGVAEEAIRIGGDRPHAGVVSGYAAKAQALAHLGHQQDAEAALRQLEVLFEKLPDDVRDDRSSQWGWSIQRYHHVAGFVYTFSGDVDRANRAHEAALSSYPAANYQGRGQVELYRAGSLIRSGDLQEGTRHLVTVLTALPAERRHDSLLRRTALTALSLAPTGADRHPGLIEAHDLLAPPAEGP